MRRLMSPTSNLIPKGAIYFHDYAEIHSIRIFIRPYFAAVLFPVFLARTGGD